MKVKQDEKYQVFDKVEINMNLLVYSTSLPNPTALAFILITWVSRMMTVAFHILILERSPMINPFLNLGFGYDHTLL